MLSMNNIGKSFALLLVVLFLISLIIFQQTAVNAQLSSKESSADWPMFLHDSTHSGATNSVPVEGVQLWSFYDGQTMGSGQVGDYLSSSPVEANGIVYQGSDLRGLNQPGGTIYAINSYTGKEIWRHYTPSGVDTTPALSENTIFVSYGNGFLALNSSTGSFLWESAIGGAPTVVNGIVYMSSDAVYALNASTGAKIWVNPAVQPTGFPAVANGIVYVGSGSGFFALNAKTGGEIWSYPQFRGTASSCVNNGIVYTGDIYGNVTALDASNGARIWTFTTNFFSQSEGIQASPAVADGIVYVGSGSGGGLYALNATTGTQIWNQHSVLDRVYSSVAISSGIVYVGSAYEDVFAFNATNGSVIWDLHTNLESYKASFRSSPALANGILYIKSEDGNLYAIGKPSLPVPTPTPSSAIEALNTPITITSIAVVIIVLAVGILVLYKRHRKNKNLNQ